MHTGEAIIYVAGNPDLYPLEYYDRESGTYRGAIPAFLEGFAQAYGYDLRYLEPGSRDRRAELASNRQVDLISGCRSGEHYEYTEGEPLLLLRAEAEGAEEVCLLCFTQMAPAAFQAELRAYAAQTSDAAWNGAILTAVGEEPPQAVPTGGFLAVGVAAALLLAAWLITLRRLRRARGQAALAPQVDPATGLGTDRSLAQAFSKLERDQSRRAYALICVHLDLDRVGCLRGQEQAEELLRHGAQVLREAAEPGDLLARSSWGDLLVLKRFPGRQEAEAWSHAAVEAIREFPRAGGPLLPGDVTAGICCLEQEYQSLDQALFHARQCALAAGREESACRECGTERCQSCQERWKLLDDFSRALERQEFQLYLQFFVDAQTFRIVGGEALSRWNHPRLGQLSPDRYVPLLERDGRISALDFRGLEQTCAFLEALDQQGVRDFFISCNFSRKTFSAPDFARRCAEVIRRYDFTRKLLILEVTETQQIDQREVQQMLRNIQEVRAQGARVIFDDFGMGFSSFHDLQDYPMDGLKLDKELVDNMETERGRIILNALVETGHRMGLTILAEGVEEDRQIEVLRGLHCDVLQGYRFSVPLPAAEARRRILDAARKGGAAKEGETET